MCVSLFAFTDATEKPTVNKMTGAERSSRTQGRTQNVSVETAVMLHQWQPGVSDCQPSCDRFWARNFEDYANKLDLVAPAHVEMKIEEGRRETEIAPPHQRAPNPGETLFT
jgi:hypothetical protein